MGCGALLIVSIDEGEETDDYGAEWAYRGRVVEAAGGAVWTGERQV